MPKSPKGGFYTKGKEGDVSEEIKKVAPATAIPDRYIRKGAAKTDNPEWALWVESGLPKWQTAMEYIKSVEPEKRGSKIEGKGPSSEWTIWNKKAKQKNRRIIIESWSIRAKKCICKNIIWGDAKETLDC